MASTMAKVIWLTLATTAMPKTYDSHGCCMSCGELWCDGACTTDMAACASGASDLARCTFSWANLHWDLSPLRDAKPADQYYAISDNYVHSHQNWSYVVGVCRDVGLAAAPEACASTRGSGGDVYDFPSPGYQIFKGDWGFEECYRLGSPVDRSNYAWGLIDPQSPAFGIYVQYKGGNTCTDSISDKAECEDVIDGRTYCARSLRINVVCNNRISDIPRVEEVVEKRGCEYALTLNSMYGCPTECPVSGGSVCGNRGVCAYDGVESGYTVTGDVGAARCLCKAPYAGAACEAVATAAAADERPPRNALFWVGLASLVFRALPRHVLARAPARVPPLGPLPLVRAAAAGRDLHDETEELPGRGRDGEPPARRGRGVLRREPVAALAYTTCAVFAGDRFVGERCRGPAGGRRCRRGSDFSARIMAMLRPRQAKATPKATAMARATTSVTTPRDTGASSTSSPPRSRDSRTSAAAAVATASRRPAPAPAPS